MQEFTAQQQAELFDAPIPGESLTADPKNPKSFETPPEYTDLNLFIDDLFMNITSKDNRDGVLDPIRKGIPIEDIAQLLLFQAMASGKITTDLVLTAVEPTIYMLIGLSEYAGIPNPVLYPEDDMLIDEEDEISALEEAASKGTTKIENLPVPKGVSKSLINKLQGGEL